MTFAEGSQLKEIGPYAFAGEHDDLRSVITNKLTEVQIPASVQIIGKEAFYKCENLRKVAFAEGSQLQKLGPGVFAGCDRLKIKNAPEIVRQEWPRASRAHGCGAL